MNKLHRYAKKKNTNEWTYLPHHGPTNHRTDEPTDAPSYAAVFIAAENEQKEPNEEIAKDLHRDALPEGSRLQRTQRISTGIRMKMRMRKGIGNKNNENKNGDRNENENENGNRE